MLQKTVDKLLNKSHGGFLLGTTSWLEQFKDALTVGAGNISLYALTVGASHILLHALTVSAGNILLYALTVSADNMLWR